MTRQGSSRGQSGRGIALEVGRNGSLAGCGAFDLQTDKEGNFYFSKAAPVLSGGRGFSELTEHTGTILKVSSDGRTSERMAWGLRAPGGLGIGPNGEMTTGENEGSYVPRCKITWSKLVRTMRTTWAI